MATDLVFQTNYLGGQDAERRMVTSLTQAVEEAGIHIAPEMIVNVYVALKSKPLLILAGPAYSGKIAFLQCLSCILTGGNCLQSQMLTGHPWWAGKYDNIAIFTEMHSRFISGKFFSLIEEAWQPENLHQVFLSCLTRISPAELLTFFTEVAFQLRHGQIMRAGSFHLLKPIPYPRNLFWIGTIDTTDFSWWDNDLLAETSVIHWPEACFSTTPSWNLQAIIPVSQREFLHSQVRNKEEAFHRLYTILANGERQPLQQLMKVDSLLRKYTEDYLDYFLDEAIIYLANSWSQYGFGLFTPSTSNNLPIALDIVIAQILLPHASRTILYSEHLQKSLEDLLGDKFPRSQMALSCLSGQHQIYNPSSVLERR